VRDPMRVLAVLLAPFLATATIARAQTATPWNEHPNAKVRLIAGEGRMLGIELQIAPGWKTYWRMPGDAGVPPTFEWAGSKNIKSAEVLYPAPETMIDAAGVSVGYKSIVIFPVKLALKAEGQPAVVALDFAFGVCKDICIPIESKLSITLDGGKAWPTSTALKAHMARVPVVAADVAAAAPLITSIAQDAPGNKPRLVVTTANARDVYIEAPDGLYVPMSRSAGGGRFDVDLSASADFKDLIGKPLRITATTANGGVETSVIVK
jgi:DsbC/DsbD-like thiol-disulfide interchange protein